MRPSRTAEHTQKATALKNMSTCSTFEFWNLLPEEMKLECIKNMSLITRFAILYFFFTIACLLIAPVVDLITAKWSMVVGFFTYIAFQLGFLELNSAYLYTTSALLGIGAAFLWVGQGKYLTENCTSETIERNTALMWLIFKFSLLGGGVFLYFMFQDQTMHELVLSGDCLHCNILLWASWFRRCNYSDSSLLVPL